MRFPPLFAQLAAIAALGVSAGACCPAKITAPTTPPPESVPMPNPEPLPGPTPDPTPEPVLDPAPETPREAADIPEGQRHSLSILGGRDVSVGLGDVLTFSYEHHPSVGHHADWSLPGQNIVAFVRNDIIYKTPERLQQGMTGADGGTGTFVFKAVSRGSVTLEVRTLFRGQVENSGTFNVTVR